jgi:photosystem II stability/assembly factor-like uncharacterized protein
MRTNLQLSILFLALAALIHGQPKKAATPKAVPSTNAAAPKWKAIWEPVPFNKDIELRAVYCVGPETCWVAGRKSTILFTSDGGKSWKAQLGGDPDAADEDLADIFFLDSRHGWVMTERNRILGTADGSTWAELGKVPATSRGLWFLTPLTGLVADRHDSQSQTHLNRTENGGKSWTRGSPCGLEAVMGGLARRLGCMVRRIQFVSPAVGFMGGGAPVSIGAEVAVFSRTVDGGVSWVHSIIPDTKHAVEAIHFWSERDGLAVLASGQAYWTADAGAQWTGSVNAPAWRSFYASGEGKILVGVQENGRQIGYSFNGGRTFASRPASLPARVRDVYFPDSRHGYLVGEHGMVYRYRIVPVDYTSEGMFSAAAPSQ